MTHPRDGHGILFEICSRDMPNDPRLPDSWSTDRWRDGPLGILRLWAMGIAVRDLEAAVSFYVSVTGADFVHREQRPGVGRWPVRGPVT